MNKKLYLVAAFVLGGLAGFAVAKARKDVDKAMDENNHMANMNWEKEEPEEEPAEDEQPIKADYIEAGKFDVSRVEELSMSNKPDVMEYAAKLRESGYKRDYSSSGAPEIKPEEEPEEPEDYIFVISPDEFGEDEDYKKISLTDYSDGVLADENNHIILDEDMVGMVGDNFEQHFGEYEDDSVFIRNDRLKCYFEILADPRRYADILKAKPYLKED